MAVDNSVAIDLLRQGLPESDYIDYKIEFSSPSEAAKRELAKDVCAFANSQGGWLFIGVGEDERRPTTYPGIERQVGNQFVIDWVQNVVASRITPLVNLMWYTFTTSDLPGLPVDRVVVALHILHSPSFPHFETVVGHHFVRRDAESKPAGEGEIRRMYFEAHSAPRLAITPGYVPLLNWRPAIRIYNIGNAPALNVHGRLGFGAQVTEDTDLSGSAPGAAKTKEVNIPLLLPGLYESYVADDVGTNERFVFWSAGKVLWSGTFSDHAGIEYESRQLFDLHHWEESIVSGSHMWPSVLSELKKEDLQALGLWSGHLEQSLKNRFENDGQRLRQVQSDNRG